MKCWVRDYMILGFPKLNGTSTTEIILSTPVESKVFENCAGAR